MTSLPFREKELIIQGLKRQIMNKRRIIHQFKDNQETCDKYQGRINELEILIEKVEWM